MKKWLSLLLMFSMVMLLVACGGSSNDYDEPEDYEVEDEEAMAEDELDEPEVDPEIGILRSEAYPDDQMWFLLRDDKTYSLGTTVHMVEGVDYSSAGARLDDADLAVYQIERMLTPSDLTGFCSYGNVPVPVLSENDLVVSYSDSSVPTLGLHSMLYSGDAVCFEHDSNLCNLKFYDAENHEVYFKTGVDSADVTDEDGESVLDWCDLERDENYTVSWFEGTQYNEYSMKAECKFYDDDENDLSVAYRFEPEYEIEGERTKNGYATYDLSDIPAGIYCVVDPETLIHGGLIEIE